MKQFLVVLILLISINDFKSQLNNTNFNPNRMKTFDKHKFEDNKGKQGYANEYHYSLSNDFNVKEYSTLENNEEMFKQEITKEFTPHSYKNTYYQSGLRYAEIINFNTSLICAKEYDKNGKLIKEINLDTVFKHTFEQIHALVLKEKGVDIYDTRQAVALRHNPTQKLEGLTIKNYYQIHVLKTDFIQGEWLSQPDYSFLIDDETGEILNQEDIDKKRSSSVIYRTHEGKAYTRLEWDAFEEKQYEEYCKKTGRPYTPKNTKGLGE